MKLLIAIQKLRSLAVCCAVVCTANTVQAQILPGWDNVWSDEFNGTSIDYSRWEVANREHSPNNELQYYLPSQVTVNGGQLHITATDQPIASKSYRSGLIRTWREHLYGRWEIRANLPTGQGMWPAIWLLPRNAEWPVGGEIDILENIGSNTFAVLGSYHYNWTPGSPITTNQWYGASDNGQPVDFAAGFHDYAVEWGSDQLRFYVDDNLYLSIDNPQQPQVVPMSLIINLAVGGNFPGSPDGSTAFPQTFDIEHARYWTRDEKELINPNFDRSGATVNGWTLFGSEITNVSVQSEAVLNGTHALKLFGQFTGSENYSGAAQGIVVTPGQNIFADASVFVRSQDSIFGTDNQVLMKLEYYSSFGAGHGGPDFLGEVPIVLADGGTTEDAWHTYQITDVVPSAAVEARLSFVFSQPGYGGGAVHIDGVSLVASDPVLVGDLNGDGFVGIIDLGLVLGSWNTNQPLGSVSDPSGDGYVGIEDLNTVLGGWNQGSPPGVAIPEPVTIVMMSAAGALLIFNRQGPWFYQVIRETR